MRAAGPVGDIGHIARPDGPQPVAVAGQQLQALRAVAADLAAQPLGRRYGLGAQGLWAGWQAAADRGELVLGSWLGGQAVGVLHAVPRGAFGAPYLAFLGVCQHAQGRGVGRQLVAAFAAALPSPARGHFLLATADNLPAQAFYRALGFAAAGKLPAFAHPRHDELIFWRPPRS